MIQVDISNIWGQISLPDLLEMEKDVSLGFDTLREEELRREVSREEEEAVLTRMEQAAEKIRGDSQVCVVLGSCPGARAAIELLRGSDRNLTVKKGEPLMVFAGDSLSTRRWNRLMELLEDRDFSVVAVSRKGRELESAVTFRGLRWMMERRYGTDRANGRIYAVTGTEDSVLRQMAEEKRWETFDIPAGTEGTDAVLTPAGLLPMAVAGLDIRQMLEGVREVTEDCGEPSLENPLWQYAAVRNLMLRSGKDVELLGTFEPDLAQFGAWWQRLFAGAEGKDGKGLFPVPVRLTGNPGGLEQLIPEGRKNLFETMLRFDPPEQKYTVGTDWKDPDGLNYLEGWTLDRVEQQVYEAILATHVDSGVPVITVDCGECCESTMGGLFAFFQLASRLSARILGVDSRENSAEQRYRSNMDAMLGRSGGEN